MTLRELRKHLGLLGMEKAGCGLGQKKCSLGFDSLWCTAKQNFSPYFADPHLCPRKYPIPLSSSPDINKMQGTKYVRTSQVTVFSVSIHFCLVLESLCACISAWVSAFTLHSFPYILVGLLSILHFQCLFCNLEIFRAGNPTVSNYTLRWLHFSSGENDWELFEYSLVSLSALYSGLFLIALPLQTSPGSSSSSCAYINDEVPAKYRWWKEPDCTPQALPHISVQVLQPLFKGFEIGLLKLPHLFPGEAPTALSDISPQAMEL